VEACSCVEIEVDRHRDATRLVCNTQPTAFTSILLLETHSKSTTTYVAIVITVTFHHPQLSRAIAPTPSPTLSQLTAESITMAAPRMARDNRQTVSPLTSLIRWLQLKNYQYEVTFSLYMLTYTEKIVFSKLLSFRGRMLMLTHRQTRFSSSSRLFSSQQHICTCQHTCM